MNKKPFITIAIPFYNSELYLEDSICSVLAQTYKKWELLLIDDGSTDHSLDIARKYEALDTRIRVISDGINRKLPYRLNQVIQESKYDYIARMDSDDLMSPNRLEMQINHLRNNPNFDLVSTGLLSLKKNSILMGYRIPSSRVITLDDAVMGRTGIVHASVVARKSWYQRNRYNETRFLAQDYDLWLKAFLNDDLKVGFIQEPLYYYREDQNIKIEKLFKAYSTQIKVIKSLPLKYASVTDKIKLISKIKTKAFISKGLFMLNLEDLLHRRRVQSENIEKYSEIFASDLETIRKEKLL